MLELWLCGHNKLCKISKEMGVTTTLHASWETFLQVKIAGRNINNFRYADVTTFMAESEEELKSLLMKMKEESEKSGLKFNIQKTKIMASGPITSWQIDGETGETVTDFIFWGSKIIADSDSSQENKKCLLFRKNTDRPFSWASKLLQIVTTATKLKDTCSLEGKPWQI